jgi:hypothetical protein
MTDEQESAGSRASAQQQQTTPAIEVSEISRSQNPWLNVLGYGSMILLIGIILYFVGLTNGGGVFDSGRDEVMMAWGLLLGSLGLVLFVAWLTANAICWQLKRNSEQQAGPQNRT